MDGQLVVLLSTVSTGIIALLGLLIRYSFLSKCIKIKCCCCEIERDVEGELKEIEIKPTLNNDSPSSRNIRI